MQTEKIMQHLIGKTYEEVILALSTDEDQGDCCGWANLEITDEVNGNPSAKLVDVVRIDYEEEEFDRVVVNFIFDVGGNKGVILGYDLSAGSGSGWRYRAYVTLKYGDEEVASASY